MISNLVSVFANIFKEGGNKNKTFTIKKEKVISELNDTIEVLANEVMPPLENLLLLIKEKKISDKELKTSFTLNFIVDGSREFKGSPVKFLHYIRETLSNIIMSQREIEKCIEKTFKSAVTTDRSMTLGEICAIDLVKAINLVTVFTSDLILIVSFDLRSGTKLNKKFIGKVNSCAVAYLASITNLSPKSLKERLELITTAPRDRMGDAIHTAIEEGADVENPEKNDDVTVGGIKNIVSGIKGFTNMFSTGFVGRQGFVYSPIYHLRMAWADFQANRYEALKNNKQTTEAILLDLRLKKEGTNDPTIDKQIKYYEDKLVNIQYKIAQYEEELKE